MSALQCPLEMPVIQLVTADGNFNTTLHSYLTSVTPIFESAKARWEKDRRNEEDCNPVEPETAAASPTEEESVDEDETESEDHDDQSDEDEDGDDLRTESEEEEEECEALAVSPCEMENASRTDDLCLEAPAARDLDEEEVDLARKAKRLSVLNPPIAQLEDEPFNIIAFMGAPRSGVSTMLNRLYGCTFPAATSSKDNQSDDSDASIPIKRRSIGYQRGQRTTQGIYAAKLRHSSGRHLILLDMGACDGSNAAVRMKHWRATMMFVLAISDAVGIHLTYDDLDAAEPDEHPEWLLETLRIIVTVQTHFHSLRDRDLPKARYLIFFFVKDWSSRMSEDIIEEELIPPLMAHIWETIKLPAMLRKVGWEEFYEPQVIPVPDLRESDSPAVQDFRATVPSRIMSDMPSAHMGDVNLLEFCNYAEQVHRECLVPCEPFWRNTAEVLMMFRCIAIKEKIEAEMVNRIQSEDCYTLAGFWANCQPRKNIRTAFAEFRLHSAGYPARLTRPVAHLLYEAVCQAYDPIVRRILPRAVRSVLRRFIAFRNAQEEGEGLNRNDLAERREDLLREFDTFVGGFRAEVRLEDGTYIRYDYGISEIKQWLGRQLSEIIAAGQCPALEEVEEAPDVISMLSGSSRFHVQVAQNPSSVASLNS